MAGDEAIDDGDEAIDDVDGVAGDEAIDDGDEAIDDGDEAISEYVQNSNSECIQKASFDTKEPCTESHIKDMPDETTNVLHTTDLVQNIEMDTLAGKDVIDFRLVSSYNNNYVHMLCVASCVALIATIFI